ncbi:MAG: radical SAM protein [Deltaproteobacteria bacterium]|nr:radical SAM protein [Deltaproteobacteria bacterium]
MSGSKIKLGAHDGLHGIFHHLDSLQKWRRGEDFPPLYVEVSPTNQCNQRCFYCYVDHLGYGNTFMPREMIVKLFHDMGASGVKCCEIQGTGEPLLNKALPEAIVAGKKHGLSTVLVTNATLFKTELIEEILPCLSFLRISSMAHDAKTYARLHGSSESHFDLVIKALKDCVRVRDAQHLDVVIVCTFLLFDFNMPHLVETARMLKEIGVDVFKLWPTIDQGRNQNHDWKRDHFHKIFTEEIQRLKELNDDHFHVYLNSENLDFFMSPIPPEKPYPICYGVEFETHIDADGKIYPCQFCWKDERYCLGDLTQSNFKEIWGSNQRKERMQLFLKEVNTNQCRVFCCKQHSINDLLYQLANPPRHVNVL